MPNPQTVTCNADEWTLIAAYQVWGYLYKLDKKPNKYLYTYRLTGATAPTGQSEGIPIFTKDDKFTVIGGVGIDIYVMAVGDSGKVRYDWWF